MRSSLGTNLAHKLAYIKKKKIGNHVMCSKTPDKLECFRGLEANFQGELFVKGTLRIDGLRKRRDI